MNDTHFLALQTARSRVNSLQADLRVSQRQLETEAVELADAEQRMADAEMARDILQAVGQLVQSTLHDRIASVVSLCLEAADFGQYQFRIDFQKKRNKTEARFVFIKDGEELEAKANRWWEGEIEGGCLDITAFALRIAALLLAKPPPRRILIADEPFRFVRGHRRELIADMVDMLARELDFQIILVPASDGVQIGEVVWL